MDFKDLVKNERLRRGWSARELARRADVEPSAVTRIEKGQQLGRADTVARVAAALEIDAGTVQKVIGKGEAAPVPTERSVEDVLREALALVRKAKGEEARERRRRAQSKTIYVPVVQSFGAAGEGAVAETETWPYVPTPEQVGHHIFGMRVKGGCLVPRLRDGDQAYIDRDASPHNDDIVAMLYDDESLFRILDGDSLVSLSGHPPIPLADERVRLEGVVVFAGRRP